MKSFAVAVLVFAWAAAHAAAQQSQVPRPVPPPPDLRQALQQYMGGTAPAPRQLTAPERAELRRQLTEYAQPSLPVSRR